MKALNFSPASLFHLQQLANKVKQKTGTRHAISDPTETLHLLRYCCRCEDSHITETYYQFAKELDEAQRDQLNRYGIPTSTTTALQYNAENLPIGAQ